MILTRWFSFAAPPKCGCIWFRRILTEQGIPVFGETVIEKVGAWDRKDDTDRFRHHVPCRLPSITILRDPAAWLRSYLHHFKGKKIHIPCVDRLIDLETITLDDVEATFKQYRWCSTYVINLDDNPAEQVIHIFEMLGVPNYPDMILSLPPQNVTDYEKQLRR